MIYNITCTCIIKNEHNIQSSKISTKNILQVGRTQILKACITWFVFALHVFQSQMVHTANDSLNKNDLTFSGIFELNLIYIYIYIGMLVQLSYIYETVCNYIKHILNQEFIHNKTSYHSTTP